MASLLTAKDSDSYREKKKEKKQKSKAIRAITLQGVIDKSKTLLLKI